MLPDTAVGLPPTATATTTSFDPWDMPYFGAAIYFSYQATLWYPGGPGRDIAVPAASSPTTGSPLWFDPWDAPYFGGAVYFRYSPALPDRPVQSAPALLGTDATVSVPSSLQPEPALGRTAAGNASAGEQTHVRNDRASPRKRSWWARLFGQG